MEESKDMPTIEEMWSQVKQHREKENEIMENMTEDEKVEYILKRNQEAMEIAKNLGKTPVKLEDIEEDD